MNIVTFKRLAYLVALLFPASIHAQYQLCSSGYIQSYCSILNMGSCNFQYNCTGSKNGTEQLSALNIFQCEGDQFVYCVACCGQI